MDDQHAQPFPLTDHLAINRSSANLLARFGRGMLGLLHIGGDGAQLFQCCHKLSRPMNQWSISSTFPRKTTVRPRDFS